MSEREGVATRTDGTTIQGEVLAVEPTQVVLVLADGAVAAVDKADVIGLALVIDACSGELGAVTRTSWICGLS